MTSSLYEHEIQQLYLCLDVSMLIAMKVLKQVLVILIVILISVPLGACGVATPMPTATVISMPSLTPSAVPAGTVPTPTPTPSFTTSTPIPLLSVPEGLRMVYRTPQGLYIKDGSKPSRQLTQHLEDINPRISDDGQKIVFERWVTPLTLYSINADGSDERALVTRSKLTELNLGYDAFGVEYTAFVPGTHLLLFQTSDSQGINSDLLLVNTDTGEIKSLLPLGKAFDYYVSPDGTKIALSGTGKPGHIDILSINGEMLQDNIATYTRSEPIPLLPNIHWAQDSNSLTIVLPYPTFYDTSGGAPNYTLWHYTLGENKSIQVPLDPMPKDLVEVSPDGNWVTYRDDSGALYVGNLRDGNSQVYDPQPGLPLCAWSSDSVHFIYGRGRLYLGAVNTPPVFFGKGDCISWLDAERFLYYDYVDKTIVMGGIDGGKIVVLTEAREAFKGNSTFTFILLD